MTLKACYNYAHFPLADKFKWVNGTPGINAVQGSASSMNTMGNRLSELTTAGGRAMQGLGLSWTGPASAAAQRSSAQMVQRATQTQGLTANGADRVLDYGHSFEWMRKQIVYDDPANHTWLEKATDRVAGTIAAWTGNGDYQTIAQRNHENDEAANRALGQHEMNTVHADDAFTTTGMDPRHAQSAGAGAPGAGASGTGHTAGAGSTPPHVAPASVAPGTAAAPPVPTGAPPAAGGTGPGAGGAAPGAGGTTPLPTPLTPGAGGRPGTGVGAGSTGTPGTGSGARGLDPTTSTAGMDPAGTREQLGRQFGQDLGERSLGSPSALGGGTPAADWYGAGSRNGRLPGSSGWGGLDDPLRSGPLGEGTGGRAGSGERLRSGNPLLGEGAGGRAASGTVSVAGRGGNGLGSGYAPMMGAGGARQDGTPHRNRYLLPSSAPFDVDVPHTPPVLGPDEDGDG